MNNLSLLGIIALQYANVPYKWNGKNPLIGLDCSGFVERCLRDIGFYKSIWHRTAQQLYEHCSLRAYSSEVSNDCLLFFGESIEKITHVAIAIDEIYMINSSGGDSSTQTLQDAIDNNARVKIERIDRRRDLVASIKIDY